jgi:RNA polymerase sigma factor (sigma-70 family)
MEEARVVREGLILSNLGLVFKLAGRFSRRPQQYQEMVSDGCLGLLRAVDKYDPSRGVKFSTYAYSVIKFTMIASIRKTVRDGQIISLDSLPDHRDDLHDFEQREYLDHLLSRLNRKEKAVIQARADGKSLAWVARNLGVSKETVNKIRRQAQDKCRGA